MTLHDILLSKGGAVYTIGPDVTLDEASKQLVKYRVGALLVVEPEAAEPKMIGIISERDCSTAQASGKGSFTELLVGEVMTSEVLTGTPDDSLDSVMALMTTKRIRHLPVVLEGQLIGIISIGDLVKRRCTGWRWKTGL